MKIEKNLKAETRSHADLVKLGLAKKSKWDMTEIKYPYFSYIPDELKVNETTEIGTRLWAASDFVRGGRKEVFFLKSHRNKNGEQYLDAYNSENMVKVFLYDSVCKIPATHNASKATKVETSLKKRKPKKTNAK